MGLDLEPQRVSTPLEDLEPMRLNGVDTMNKSPSAKTDALPELDPVNMSDDQRLDRLETIVFDLKKDMDHIKPAFKNLMNLEGQISNLLVELQALRTGEAPDALMPLGLKEDASAPPMNLTESTKPTAETEKPSVQPLAAAPMSAEAARPKTGMEPVMDDEPVAKMQKTSKAAPVTQKAPSTGKAMIQNIRVGSYPNKTRIVLDLTNKPEFATDLDAAENLFTINFMNGGIASDIQISPLKNTLVSAITETQAGDGRMVIFALNKQTRLIKQATLPPSKDSQYYRAFFDFAK